MNEFHLHPKAETGTSLSFSKCWCPKSQFRKRKYPFYNNQDITHGWDGNLLKTLPPWEIQVAGPQLRLYKYFNPISENHEKDGFFKNSEQCFILPFWPFFCPSLSFPLCGQIFIRVLARNLVNLKMNVITIETVKHYDITEKKSKFLVLPKGIWINKNIIDDIFKLDRTSSG